MSIEPLSPGIKIGNKAVFKSSWSEKSSSHGASRRSCRGRCGCGCRCRCRCAGVGETTVLPGPAMGSCSHLDNCSDQPEDDVMCVHDQPSSTIHHHPQPSKITNAMTSLCVHIVQTVSMLATCVSILLKKGKR